MQSFSYQTQSVINCEKHNLWLHITQMKNVNYELSPFVRMTYPADRTNLQTSEVPLKTILFKSVILLFGFIPVDLHCLKLDKIVTDEAFYENSTTLTHKYWKHTRTLTAITNTTTQVKDEVEFAPRIPLIGYLLLPVYKFIFAHRHKRLGQYYKTQSG